MCEDLDRHACRAPRRSRDHRHTVHDRAHPRGPPTPRAARTAPCCGPGGRSHLRRRGRGGAVRGSQGLTFVPRTPVAGHHTIDIGTAGSVCLVAQLALVPLLNAPSPSSVTVVGGTHTRHAPPADCLQQTFLPQVTRTGGRVELRLERHGFEPAGGGRITLMIDHAQRTTPLTLDGTGPVRLGRARALLSQLPYHIGRRELHTIATELDWPQDQLSIEHVVADGPGHVVLLEIERAGVTEVISAVGRPGGLPAEQVAQQAVVQARRYLASTAPVGPLLADQLLVPLVLGAGGTYRTIELTTTTNAHVLRHLWTPRSPGPADPTRPCSSRSDDAAPGRRTAGRPPTTPSDQPHDHMTGSASVFALHVRRLRVRSATATSDGVSHYVPDCHRVEPTDAYDLRDLPPVGQAWIVDAPAVLVIVGVEARTAARLGPQPPRRVRSMTNGSACCSPCPTAALRSSSSRSDTCHASR
jgi:RNA 3'-terminal phosphate cyclase (ATP)